MFLQDWDAALDPRVEELPHGEPPGPTKDPLQEGALRLSQLILPNQPEEDAYYLFIVHTGPPYSAPDRLDTANAHQGRQRLSHSAGRVLITFDMVESLVLLAVGAAVGWLVSNAREARVERKHLRGLLAAVRDEAVRNRDRLTPVISPIPAEGPPDKDSILRAYVQFNRLLDLQGAVSLDAWQDLKRARVWLSQTNVLDLGHRVEEWIMNLRETAKPPEFVHSLPPRELVMPGTMPASEQKEKMELWVRWLHAIIRVRIRDSLFEGLTNLESLVTATEEALVAQTRGGPACLYGRRDRVGHVRPPKLRVTRAPQTLTRGFPRVHTKQNPTSPQRRPPNIF